MKVLIQRVSKAAVAVAGEEIAAIGHGLLLLVGIGREDGEAQLDFLAEKVVNLRIFEDEQGRMNRSLLQVGGELLVVSQFTLLADCTQGRRPSFFEAMEPERAEPMVGRFCERLRAAGVTVAQGRFGAHMEVKLVNDGPVTILLDSGIRRNN